MVRKASLILLAVLVLAALVSPLVFAQAADGPAVLRSSTNINFPDSIKFNVSAQSNVNMVDIRLRYTVDRQSFTKVVSEAYVEFTPATAVDTSWTLEMVKVGGLPPGSSLSYWWVVRDAAGKSIETTPTRVQFDDTRYSWRQMTSGKLTLYWYQGGDSFASALLDAGDRAQATLLRDTGAGLDSPVKAYIYASASDLRGAMINAEEWVGGGAFIGYNIMAIGVPTSNLDYGISTMAHELTHLVIDQITRNPYSGLPVWLSEGLAMHSEGPITTGNLNLLRDALASDALISVRSLSSPFSALPGLAYLSYAESQSIVEYLINSYGQAKMLDLLRTFQQGSTYDDALNKAYGFNADGLYTRWRDSLVNQFQGTGSGGRAAAAAGVS